MKQCSAFVINCLFLWCFLQHKGLSISKLTVSQMGNKLEQHTQIVPGTVFNFNLFSLHSCGWMTFSTFWIYLFFCLWVGYCLFVFFSKKTLFISLRYMVSARSDSPTASASFLAILITVEFIICKCKRMWTSCYASFDVCWVSLPAFKLYDLHSLSGRKILQVGYRIYIQTRPWLCFLLIFLNPLILY